MVSNQLHELVEQLKREFDAAHKQYLTTAMQHHAAMERLIVANLGRNQAEMDEAREALHEAGRQHKVSCAEREAVKLQYELAAAKQKVRTAREQVAEVYRQIIAGKQAAVIADRACKEAWKELEVAWRAVREAEKKA